MSRNAITKTFEKIEVLTSSSGQVNESGFIISDNNYTRETLYCKKLVVGEELILPGVNNEFINNSNRSNRIGANENFTGQTVSNLYNTTAGKIRYDSESRSVKVSNDRGEYKNISDTDNSIIKANKYKQVLLLEGWSPNNSNYVSLKQNTRIGIDLDDHVFYQGHGYIVGINKQDADTDVAGVYNDDETQHTYTPISCMFRLDYFVASAESMSTIENQPVNYLGFSLINNIDANLEIEVVNTDGRPYLNIKVNSNKETKWYAVINLQKVYVKSALDKNSDDMIKHSTTDNSIIWEEAGLPDPNNNNLPYKECIFKFRDTLVESVIKPFNTEMVRDSSNVSNSVFSNNTEINIKNVVTQLIQTGNHPIFGPIYSEQTRESIDTGGEGNTDDIVFLEDTIGLINYNTYTYSNDIVLQASNNIMKSMVSMYGHSLHINDGDNSKICVTNNILGNSFTKNTTIDAENFSTIFTTDANNIKIAYQLEEKEHKYKPTICAKYLRLFSTKRIDSRDISQAHREKVYQIDNTVDISNNFKQSLVLYKHIGDFIKDNTKEIYCVDTQVLATDEVSRFSLRLGTHNFIKSYISIRKIRADGDTTPEECAFFTHYASILVPSYSSLREYFVKLRDDDIENNAGTSTLITMQNNIKNTYKFSKNPSDEGEDNVVFNYLEKDKREVDENNTEYSGLAAFTHFNDSNNKRIDNTENYNVDLIDFDINLLTEPVLATSTSSANNISGSLEDAYNTFSVDFPLKLECTRRDSLSGDKYQVYILLEINSFQLDTY